MIFAAQEAFPCDHIVEQKERVQEDIDLLMEDIERLRDQMGELNSEEIVCKEEEEAAKNPSQTEDDHWSDHQTRE